MKLLITAFEGSAGNVLYDYVQQTMEIPHVPLQVKFDNDFNTETDFIISIIRHPRDILAFILNNDINKEFHYSGITKKDYNDFLTDTLEYNKSDELKIKKIVNSYAEYLNNVNNKSNLIFSYYHIINDMEKVIEYIFDTLRLDEQNYKNKTGRESLRNDVLNKIKDVKKPEYNKVLIPNSLDSKNEKLENANVQYEIAFDKAIKFDN